MLSNSFCVEQIGCVLNIMPKENEPKKIAFNSSNTINEIIYHIGGKSTVYFNGTQLFVRPGTVRFLPAGAISEYVVDREEFGPCIDIKFVSNCPLSEKAFTLDMNRNGKIHDLFEKCNSLWIGKEDGYYLRCMSILYQILAIVFFPGYLSKDKQSVIEPGEKYIIEHYDQENINIPQLAQMCNISETYFKQLFTAKHGMTPKKYITYIRMEKAKNLLLVGEYSVSSVAEMVGYENIYYFSRIFKQELGMSPTSFQKKYITEGVSYSETMTANLFKTH